MAGWTHKSTCLKLARTASVGLLVGLIFLPQVAPPARAQNDISPTVLTVIESAAHQADANILSAVVIDAISSYPSSLEVIVKTAARAAPAYSLQTIRDASAAFPGYAAQIFRVVSSVTPEIASTAKAIAEQPTPLLETDALPPPSPGEAGLKERNKDGNLSDFDISLGLGPALEPNYEGDDTYGLVPFPIIKISWRDRVFFDWRGSHGKHLRRGLGARLLSSRAFTVGPYLTYDAGREESESSHLKGTGNVDSALEGGVFTEWYSDSYRFSVDYKQSISGEEGHNGSLLTIAAGVGGHINDQLGVGITGWASYASRNYMIAYYGVSAQQAAASTIVRPVFNPDAGFKDIAGDVTFQFNWDANWHSLFVGQWKRLVGDAAVSPLIVPDAENQLFLGTTIGYKF